MKGWHRKSILSGTPTGAIFDETPKEPTTIETVRAIIRQNHDPYRINDHAALMQAHHARQWPKDEWNPDKENVVIKARKLIRAMVGPVLTHDAVDEQRAQQGGSS